MNTIQLYRNNKNIKFVNRLETRKVIFLKSTMLRNSNALNVALDFEKNYVLYKKEIINTKITKLYTVKNMHERKQKMYDLSDIFIALPGGIGTLEELSEIITWKSLNIKKTSIHLMNINGFYNPLISQFKKMNDNELFNYFKLTDEEISYLT